MLLMRSAAPCSLAAMLLGRFSSSYSIRHQAALALSSPSSSTTARFTAWSPSPLYCSPRGRGFSAWASAPGPMGPSESPAMQLLEAKIKEQLEADTVTVIDTSGDGRHVWCSVIFQLIQGYGRSSLTACPSRCFVNLSFKYF